MSEEGVERRLTTILSADVVGYSRLMAADEASTLAQLKSHRKELVEPKAAQYHGRTIKLMGDGTLMEFTSVVDAVVFAVEVQLAMRERNAGVPEDHRIVYRIGINIGDIIVEGDDIYGDGVNIAARLEGLADPGGVCISRPVHTQIKGKLDLTFEDLGEKEVKNIPEPVRVYRVVLDDKAAAIVTPLVQEVAKSERRWWPATAVAVLVLAAGGALWWQPWETGEELASEADMAFPLPDKPSIAVLPFANMSGEPEQEYFADGMTDDLITDLSKISGLFVIARNSSFAYKGQQVKVGQVAEELGVRYVLEGSVRRAGDEVRINAQLIDATTGGHLWAERYDGSMTDVFALQDKVTRKIVSALAIELPSGETAQVARQDTISVEAYDAYLQGWAHYVRQTPDDFRTAIPYFEKAVELDPSYGRAYAALASIYYLARSRFWHDEWGLTYNKVGVMVLRKMFENLDKAIEEHPTPLAHATAALVHANTRRHDEAIAEAETALALDPNDPIGHLAMAHTLTMSGRPKKALEYIERANRLDPHHSPSYFFELGLARFGLRDLEVAADHFEKVIEWSPKHPAHTALLATYGHLGRMDEAHTSIEFVESWWGKWRPGWPYNVREAMRYFVYKEVEDADWFAEGLRKAGLQ